MGNQVELHIFHRNRLFRDCLLNVLRNHFHAQSHDHTGPQQWTSRVSSGTHVALVDMQLPEDFATQLIHDLTQAPAGVKVLVLVGVDDHETIVRCVSAGASGCVLEEASLDELRHAIDRVVVGETFCSPQLVHSMFQQLMELSRDSISSQREDEVPLTRREREILHLMSDRLTNQEIADELSLSLYTVKNHVHNILEKLQVDDRFAAIEHARRRRLLPKSRLATLAARR
jgi:DNA-binding NarL/FixJ family response regulator